MNWLVVFETGDCRCDCGEHHAEGRSAWPTRCSRCGHRFTDAQVRVVRR